MTIPANDPISQEAAWMDAQMEAGYRAAMAHESLTDWRLIAIVCILLLLAIAWRGLHGGRP
ncbi:hypothetical protein [Mesorhizobium sp. LNJC391B00]|uniref:hypothetical protein n=1 Tax=Mesorhizobium sp. LNJC391B00 TaxID=1287273 RepID=UPI0012EB8BFC|nr:hypothetical protein [Mesorhizobium sp. LNJC391B00]